MRLYIIGYMAAGKTTFGKALAGRLDLPFIDLDEEIERRAGMTISDLMRLRGEAYFREEERKALQATSDIPDAIISCGGGTPCFFDNMEFINSSGLSIWLQASPERITTRVLDAGPTRPLVAAVPPERLKDHIEAHLAERASFYEKAQMIFDGERLETQKQIQESVNQFITLLNDR